MQLLLDTHALIWFLENDSRLTTKALEMIQKADNVFVSPINFYEMAIKIKIGKTIGLNRPISHAIELSQRSGFEWNPLRKRHLVAYQRIPLFDHHRDPFDRMILATALTDELAVISSDRNFSLYNHLVEVIW
ncbi:type II toxin-antitoxin system VapC family toxin [Spirosoma koreense]